MNRKLLLVVFVTLLLVCAVSCDAGASGTDLVFDAGNLNESWVKVAKGSRITIENMDNSMMYAVKTRGSSRGVSRRAADPSNIFKGNKDTYIPIPDKDNRASFTASSIDIQGSGSIQVIRLRDGSDDMKLDEVNDPVSFLDYDGSRVYEEYYHIDFSQEPYKSLNRSRLALLTYRQGSGSGSSSWGYATIGAGGIKPEVGTAGLYDFSGYDSINLYNTMTVISSNNQRSQQLVITNPIRYEGGTAQSILSKCSLFSVGPLNDGDDYVLEINKVSDLRYDDQFYMRYVNGDFNGFAFPVGSDSSKGVYYIGKIEHELLAEIKVYESDNNDFGTVTFRKATSEETTEYRSNFITINSDKFVFTMTLAAGDDKEHKFIVEPEVGRTLNNMYITTEYTYEDGTYIEGYCRTSTKSSHTYGIGYSNNSFIGPYTIFPQRSVDLLENLSIKVIDEKPVNVNITFEKSNSDVVDDFKINGCKLFIVPNNGQAIKSERIIINNYYTIPELKKPGYTFRGMSYNDKFYKAGESIRIEYPYSAIIAVWD